MKIDIKDLLKLKKSIFVEVEKELRSKLFNKFVFQKDLAKELSKKIVNKKIIVSLYRNINGVYYTKNTEVNITDRNM